MMRQLSLPVLAVLLGLGSQAEAAWSPSEYRCAYDSLNQDQARGRQFWARSWAATNPYGGFEPRDQSFWNSMFTREAAVAYETYGFFIYPVYISTVDWSVFLGPGAPGSSTEGLSGDQIQVLSYEYKPMHVRNDGVCEPGWSFSLERGAPQARVDLLTLHLKSGGELSVTQAHPLVTQEGVLKRARELSAGDSLVRLDGSLDEIVVIEPRAWDGELRVGAEGFLEGPVHFQSESVEELNRLLLRDGLPDDVLPTR